MRARLRRLHRLLALGFGGWFCVWLLAGSLLLWQEAGQTPQAPLAQQEGSVPLPKLLAAAQSRHPEPGSWRIVLPKRPGEAARAVFLAEDLFAEEPKVLWLDPHTATILRETEARSSFWQGLYRFHSSLWLDDRGRPVLSACALVLLALLASGLALGRRKARPGFSLAVRHRRLGLGLAPPLLISSISGLLLSLPAGWLLPTPDREIGRVRAPLTLETVVAQVSARFPGYALREIAVPQHPDEPWELALYRPGTLDVEPAWLRLSLAPDGRLAERASSLRQWVYAVHTGQVAGATGQLLLTLGGLGFGLQAAYGFRLWWHRARLKAPAPRRDAKQKIA